jgi:hypothetical protein
MRRQFTIAALAIATVIAIGTVASGASSPFDFGVWRDKHLADNQ